MLVGCVPPAFVGRSVIPYPLDILPPDVLPQDTLAPRYITPLDNLTPQKEHGTRESAMRQV